MNAVTEAARYVGRHARVLPILAVVPFAGTAVHELAHGAAAILQGGGVRAYELGPWATGGRHWGRVWYVAPPGGLRSPEIVSLAPYLTWALLGALAAAWIAARPASDRRISAAWLAYALTPLDLLQHVLGWAGGSRNDLASALGPPVAATLVPILAYGALVVAAGFPLQRRAHGAHALSPSAYVLLIVITLGAAPALSLAMQRAFG